MSTLAVCIAVAMVAVAAVMKWYLTRHWRHFYINPKELVLPRMCPVCLSTNVTEKVEEKSSERQTANYIIAREMTWWNVAVPHCSICKRKLDNGELIGLALGGICVVAALLAFPPSDVSLVLLCYMLFGYPAYTLMSTTRKGVVFGFPSSNQILARIRHQEYFQALVVATHSVPSKKRVIAL